MAAALDDAIGSSIGRGELGQIKKATSLALKHRQLVEEGDLSYFFMPLAFAIAKDFLLDPFPVIGTILGLFITVYLFIFMWGRGKIRLRIILFCLSFLDVLPIVQMIPFSTLSVLYGYHLAKKQAEESGVIIQGLSLQTLARKTRVALQQRMRQARAEAVAAIREHPQESASEAQYSNQKRVIV